MAKVSQQEYQNVQNAVNNSYTTDSLNSYKSAYQNYMSQGMSSSDAAKKASSLLVKANNNPSSSSSVSSSQKSSNTSSNSYQNQGAGDYVYNSSTGYYENTSNKTNNTSNQSIGTSNSNSGNSGVISNSYQNQGAGNYVYNPTSGYYEKQGSQTSTPVSSGGMDTTRQYWEGLSYEQQQEKLIQNPGLKESITKKGWNIKTADQGQSGITQTQVNPDGWDYQDNSPERMMQMVGNLEQLYQSDPGLFANENTFRNFFINGKGRTKEQEQFLIDYYRNRQTYNQLDGLSSAKVGSMLANGQVPDSYLNYLKNSNPQRYQEIMASKEQEENRIKDQSSYSDILNQAGFEEENNIAWQKKEGLLVDENGDLIDDRRYHEPTKEEREKVDRINEIDAEVLDIEYTYKHTYDDLVERYPGASKATLMALAQDRCSDLLRRKEDLMVEKTKLQGTVNYLQSERQQQDSAGADTINQLRQQYGMYYDYSPEGMAELAQAQYAATNVTLDQADNGTDTQKQMALQSVLDDYYNKYGSIIQRSESQVIGDVMRYAKEKGVSLSQALEENFLKPLRSKPQFATLSSGGELGYEPKIYKVGDNGYYFDENGNLVSIGGGTLGGGTTNGELYGFTNYTPISTEKKESTLNDFMNKRKEGTTGGECGSFVNDYLEALGYDRLYDDPIDKKKAVTNSDTATIGSVAVMDSKKYPQYGHVAIVTDINGDKVKLLESNRNDDHKVHTTRWVNKSDIAGYFDPSKTPSSGNAGNGGNYNPELEPFLKADPTKFSSTQWKALKNMGYTEKQFMQIRNGYLKNLASTPDATTKKILDTIGALITKYPGELALKSTMLGTDYVNNTLGNYITDYDFVKQNLTMDNLTRLKSQGATFGSLTEGERLRIENSASKLNKNKMSESAFKNELLDIYNVYAEKSGMGTLTLDDIYNMYNGSSSSGGTTKTSETSGTKSSSGGKKIINLGR